MGFSSELRAEGGELTLVHRRRLAQLKVAEHRGDSPTDYVKYGLATEILRYFLGDKWTNECVFSVHHDVARENRQSREFLGTDSKLTEERFRHQHRVSELAETLFNLKLTPGFESRVSRLRTCDLQSALAEFECAAVLAKPGLVLRFIEEQGVKGLDYEAEITTSSGDSIRCEVKSRVADSAKTSESLWRTLDHARKQLPKNSHGMVLVRLPEKWGFPAKIVDEATNKLFRQSLRVAAVVIVSEHWTRSSSGGYLILGAIRVRRNERVSSTAVDEACLAVRSPRRAPWVSLEFVAQSSATTN